MDVPFIWFIAFSVLTLVASLGGYRLGSHSDVTPRVGLIAGVLLIGVWAWLIHRPALAVQLIPLPVLSYIEGIGAVPVFGFVMGIAWSRSGTTRQRGVIAWAVVMGAVYFMQGSAWMLQATPAVGFAQTIDRDRSVLQSQDYSCVAAASATALNLLGYYTTEDEMARLTYTRPGSGSTTLRAMHGLRQRLRGTGVRVELLTTTVDALPHVPMPAITPLQFEAGRLHMVTLLGVEGQWIHVSDPMEGDYHMPMSQFRSHFLGHVLTFTLP